MSNLYDPNFVARYFDEWGEREWTRLVVKDWLQLDICDMSTFPNEMFADKNADIVRTGDLYLDASEGLRHRCHLFRGSEFREFLESESLARFMRWLFIAFQSWISLHQTMCRPFGVTSSWKFAPTLRGGMSY